MEKMSLTEAIRQNKKVLVKGGYKAPKESLISLRAWKVKQNSTLPKEETFNIVVGLVGVQIAHRVSRKEPELLLFFPMSYSKGEVRSFYTRDLEEVKLII